MNSLLAIVISSAAVLFAGGTSLAMKSSPQDQFAAPSDRRPPTVQLAANPAVKDTFKHAGKVERLSAIKLIVQPQPGVSDFQDCGVIAGSGYVGSVIAQQTVAYDRSDKRIASNPAAVLSRTRSMLARLASNALSGGGPAAALAPEIVAQAPAVAPPSPQKQPAPVTTNPRTGWSRINKMYKCAIGSAKVSATTSILGTTLEAGDQVQLLVTSVVVGTKYYSLWIEDTYQLTAQGSGPLNFGRIVAAQAYVGSDPNYMNGNTLKAAKLMPNGAFVGFQTILGGAQRGERVVCNYKPNANGYGAGLMSCAPGAPWPLQN